MRRFWNSRLPLLARNQMPLQAVKPWTVIHGSVIQRLAFFAVRMAKRAALRSRVELRERGGGECCSRGGRAIRSRRAGMRAPGEERVGRTEVWVGPSSRAQGQSEIVPGGELVSRVSAGGRRRAARPAPNRPARTEVPHEGSWISFFSLTELGTGEVRPSRASVPSARARCSPPSTSPPR